MKVLANVKKWTRFYFAAFLLVLAGAACITTAEGQSSAQSLGKHGRRLRNIQQTAWHVPTWRGLVLGKATRIAVVKKFGKPALEGPFQVEDDEEVKADADKDWLLYTYQNTGDIKGLTHFLFNARTGVLAEIWIAPKQLSLEEAIERFGSQYVEREGSLGPCPPVRLLNSDPEEREYPFFLVYPKLGMYLSVERDNSILEIGYLHKCERTS